MQKSNMKTMLKEAGILFAITLIAGILLGVVYELTKEPIRIQQEKAIQEACAAAFPDSGEGAGMFFLEASYEPEEALAAELKANGVKIGTVYLAWERGDMSGLALQFRGVVVEAVSKNGYGGDIVLYVGVSTDGTVQGVSILELSETAGLGMEAPKVLTPQFAGRNVESFVYTKTGAEADNEVDAITSATITTAAVVDAVNGGVRAARYLVEDERILTMSAGELGGGVNE